MDKSALTLFIEELEKELIENIDKEIENKFTTLNEKNYIKGNFEKIDIDISWGDCIFRIE